MTAKPIYAALPVGAIGDQRLAGLHFRVLAAIAFHDRLSLSRETGKGCVASNGTLALEAGCDYSRLSATISDLVKWGYVVKEPSTVDKRLRTYRVRYDDSLPTRKLNGLPDGKGPAEIVCRHNLQVPETVSVPVPNIFRETVIDSVETDERHSVETAPPGHGAGGNVGAILATFERRWQAGRVPRHELPAWADKLAELAEFTEHDDPNGQRAQRLLGEVEAAL
jgi:hypothetical protein